MREPVQVQVAPSRQAERRAGGENDSDRQRTPLSAAHPVYAMAARSPQAIAQRALSDRIEHSPRMTAMREQTAYMRGGPLQLASAASGAPPSGQSMVVQRLTGAGAQPGLSHTLPGTADSLGAAAMKVAQYINLRARTTATGAVEKSSQLGANNAGNLHVRSDFDEGAGAAHLETWSEMTGVGGGYVKRVRITRPGQPLMDRVMNEALGTALQRALAQDRNPAGPLAGDQRYDSVHGVHGGDAGRLDVAGNSDRSADNITKIVGEGARFGWLAKGLSDGTYGNTSQGVLNIQVNLPQEGTFTINPTFQQLWGSWDSAFDRTYMKDKNTAKIILKQRLAAGWRKPTDADGRGAAPLASGQAAAGQVTSLLHSGGAIALMPGNAGINGAGIVTDLGMTWTSDH